MKILNKDGIFIEDNNDYIDLGLPSGTLWAWRDIYRTTSFNRYKDYVSNFRLVNLIPTETQFEELAQFCDVKKYKGKEAGFYLFRSRINKKDIILFDGYYRACPKRVVYDYFSFKINIDEIINVMSKYYQRYYYCFRTIKPQN